MNRKMNNLQWFDGMLAAAPRRVGSALTNGAFVSIVAARGRRFLSRVEAQVATPGPREA
jgi:hypothetical protein